MRLNKLTCGILLAMNTVPLYSSAASVSVQPSEASASVGFLPSDTTGSIRVHPSDETAVINFSATNLSANDQTNTISGLDSSMMITKDDGHNWVAYTNEKQNSFPGTITAVVATQDANAINAVDYDPNETYGTPNTLVRYNGYYWTNQWWADKGQTPGSAAAGGVWKQGDAVTVQTLGTFLFHAYTGQDAIDFQNQQKAKVASQRKVIGYFPEWGVYDAHSNFTPDKIDFSQITHLNYGFTVVEDGVVNVYDTEKGPELMPELAKLTAEAGVANIISVGGYDNSQEGVFEVATKDAAAVEKLSQSIVDYMIKWGFNGVDVDWEYPDSAAEKDQFTSLIQSLRGKLDTLGKQNDAYYQLSSAVTANYKNIEFMNPAVTTPLMDSVNVMAYDFHGAFDPITGHNAGLYANKADPSDQKFNTSSAAEAYANTWSVPKAKLMIGIPFYGRGWGDVSATETVKGLPGLFTPGTATVHGQWDDVGQFSGTNPYNLLKTWASNPDYTRYWDSEAKVPYLYNSKTKEFFTYDDKESVQAKVDYINQNGYGGAIIWDLSGDTADHELGEVVDDILENAPVGDAYASALRIVTDVGTGSYLAFYISGNNPETYTLYNNDKYVGQVGVNNAKVDMNKTPYGNDFRHSTLYQDIKPGDVISLRRGKDGVEVAGITIPKDNLSYPKQDDSSISDLHVVTEVSGSKYVAYNMTNNHRLERYTIYKNLENGNLGLVNPNGTTERMNSTPKDGYVRLSTAYKYLKLGDVIVIVRGDDTAVNGQGVEVARIVLSPDNFQMQKVTDADLSDVSTVKDGGGNYLMFNLKDGHKADIYKVFQNSTYIGEVNVDGSVSGQMNKSPKSGYVRYSTKYLNLKAGDVITLARGDDTVTNSVEVAKVTVTADMLK